MYLLDTNILLEYPNIFDIYKGSILLSIRVIEELDRLKTSQNDEIAYKARRAIYHISTEEGIKFNIRSYGDQTVDNTLLLVAKEENAILVTNDLNLIIKAHAQDIPAINFKNIDTDYTGIEYLLMDLDDDYYNEELDKIMNTRKPPMPMKENEYLVIKNSSTDELVALMKYKNKKLELVKDNHIKCDTTGFTKPRNIEQQCLIDLLNDKEVTILAATGKFGTGKSYLLLSYALQELEAGRINKIICVPNNSIVDNTRELGLLPGDLIEKELSYLGPFIDLRGEARVREDIIHDDLEVVPMAVIRGRSFDNSIIIVNEAQNLTPEHVKLLIARCGEGTRIFFDGDIKQTDSSIFRNKNGLRTLAKLAESDEYAPLFGTIRLQKIERSKTAQASEYLDNIFI